MYYFETLSWWKGISFFFMCKSVYLSSSASDMQHTVKGDLNESFRCLQKKVVLYSHFYTCSFALSLDIKKVLMQLQWWKASRRLFTSYPLLTKSCKPHRKRTSGCCMHWKRTSLCSLNSECLLHFSLNLTGKIKMLFLKMSHPHWTRRQHGEYTECLGNIKVVIKQTNYPCFCLLQSSSKSDTNHLWFFFFLPTSIQ